MARRRCHGDDAAWDAQHAWGAEGAPDTRSGRHSMRFYIKVGQIAAAGAQMMPPAWCGALAETMDAAPPVHPRVVRRIVERDLGRSVDDVFDEWDDEPVATASVAQVHKARVNGTTVAVKVGLGGGGNLVKTSARCTGRRYY